MTAVTPMVPAKFDLRGLRVLFLPKNSRLVQFRAILEKARAEQDWDIHVVRSPLAGDKWVGRTIDTPDFTVAAPWEADAVATAEIDAFIRDCEMNAGLSAARILLAGERDLGRGFSRSAYYWFHNHTARLTLADNTEGFRILRRMFAFARQTVTATKPDLLMAGEWADALCFVFLMVAQRQGIACIANRPSKLWSGRCYWSLEPSMYNHRAAGIAIGRRNLPPSERAQQRMTEFRSAPKTLGYVQQNWDLESRRGWLSSHIDMARTAAFGIRHRYIRRAGRPPKSALQIAYNYYRQLWLERRQRRWFKRYSDDELRNLRYIFLALHKDPEQALNYQAPFWSSQMNTASLLAGSLPAGYRLLVREHRLNAGRRPTRWYRDLSRLPGVVLIDAFDDQFKYIANAGVVVTDNGSSGWEGLMLGRRVLSLADTFYDAAGLARRLRDPEEIAASLVEMLNETETIAAKSRDQKLGAMLDAEWETTAPADRPDEIIQSLAETLAGCESLLKKKTAAPKA